MTKSRSNPSRELFGILGSHPEKSALLTAWNAYFKKHGIDASLEVYPASAEQLPERLSEMFHFDRRGYIVGPTLQEAIIPLLDRSDGQGSVTLVRNVGGVLEGFASENIDDVAATYAFLREGSI